MRARQYPARMNDIFIKCRAVLSGMAMLNLTAEFYFADRYGVLSVVEFASQTELVFYWLRNLLR